MCATGKTLVTTGVQLEKSQWNPCAYREILVATLVQLENLKKL
jgi:hypothetical protein